MHWRQIVAIGKFIANLESGCHDRIRITIAFTEASERISQEFMTAIVLGIGMESIPQGMAQVHPFKRQDNTELNVLEHWPDI